jgi:uncharacterized protein YyaL (SSP411 family)
MTEKFTNSLINETSPYLLQHAHNPVNWLPWNEESLEKAKSENKPIIVSIGYSACHWCHVMEHESFEDVEVAEFMNGNFICIKVDREERPDVDQIYMDAVHAMNGQGGWPLNVFALPDGRPIHGGTYFPKDKWLDACKQVDYLLKNKEDKALQYAKKLKEGVERMNSIIETDEVQNFNIEGLENIFNHLFVELDQTNGGIMQQNKFPMPDILLFLMRYFARTKDKRALAQTVLTLNSMSAGGIYDQIGGGFARYATDIYWKVPHFEKMLYDNAQLLSVYSEAFLLTEKEEYKDIVYQTIAFMERELLSPQGAFYAALDADSEGEEGKYYLWTEEEFKNVLGEDADLIASFYGVGQEGLAENGKSILLKTSGVEAFAEQNKLNPGYFKQKLDYANSKLLEERNERIKPGLDDKILLGWNALAIKGLVDAYSSFKDKKFLQLAENAYDYILENFIDGENIYRTQNKKIKAFLEDYALFIKASISLYEATGKKDYLFTAFGLSELTIDRFYDESQKVFLFSDKNTEQLYAQKIDFSDNVIASPQSVMANNLFLLNKFSPNKKYKEIAENLLNIVSEKLIKFPSFHSNWANLFANLSSSFYELAIVGDKAFEYKDEIDRHYFPFKIYAVSENEEEQVALLQNRYLKEETLCYLCVDNSCELPVNEPNEIIKKFY